MSSIKNGRLDISLLAMTSEENCSAEILPLKMPDESSLLAQESRRVASCSADISSEKKPTQPVSRGFRLFSTLSFANERHA